MPAKPSSTRRTLRLRLPHHAHAHDHVPTHTHTHTQIDETTHHVRDSPATLLGYLLPPFLLPGCLLPRCPLSALTSFSLTGSSLLHPLPHFSLFSFFPFLPASRFLPLLHPFPLSSPFFLFEPNSTFISTSHPVSAVDFCLRLHSTSASAAVCARVNFGKIT